MLKERRTYEIMDASSVGAGETNLVLGKHSGRHAFRKKLEEFAEKYLADSKAIRLSPATLELRDARRWLRTTHWSMRTAH